VERKRVTILVVDDDHDVRKAMAGVLKSVGFAVVTAGGVNDALSLLGEDQDSSIALIVSDFNMPELNGMDFLERANKLFPEIPVVIRSGDPDPDLPQALFEAGARDFFGPGAKPEDLIKGIGILLS
jgi:DNA-binding NtrC family response regulator